MPSTIRTTCAACGTVEIAVSEARLRLSLQADDPRNTVDFTCPRCGRDGSQRVDERGTRLLGAAGIAVVAPLPDTARAADTVSGEGNGNG